MAVSSAFLDAVDGALWVKVDRQHKRVYVWKGGEAVGVFSIEDGRELDVWRSAMASAESAAFCVAEMTRAGH